MEKMKHELESEFKTLALATHNQDLRELGMDEVDENSAAFASYLDSIIFSMIPRAEFESWISYYQKKIKE